MKLNFKEVIDKSGLTQTEIAKKVDISYPTINKLYNGIAKNIYFDKLEELCILLDCTPNDVLITNNMNKRRIIKPDEADLQHNKLSKTNIRLSYDLNEHIKSVVEKELKRIVAYQQELENIHKE